MSKTTLFFLLWSIQCERTTRPTKNTLISWWQVLQQAAFIFSCVKPIVFESFISCPSLSFQMYLFHRSLFVSLCESDPGWELFRMSSRLSLLPLSLFLSLSLSLSAEHKATGIMGIIERGPLSAGPHCLWEGTIVDRTYTHSPHGCAIHTYLNNHTHTKHTFSKIMYTIIIDSKIY